MATLREDLDLLEAVLKGYPSSIAQADALAAVKRLKNIQPTADVEAPWQADVWRGGGQVVLQAHHGDHDTALIINGNFKDDAEKLEYARKFVERLNTLALMEKK